MTLKKIKNITKNRHRRSTLLIPEFIYPFYIKLFNKHKNLHSLLNHLLEKYQSDKLPIYRLRDISSCLVYQEKELKLHREDFRPHESDWVKLRLFAFSLNMSMCALFVLLLQLEIAGALGNNFVGVPTKPPKIILHQPLHTRLFSRILLIKRE